MHCTILGMVKPTLLGGIGGKLREKMSNGYRNCNYHLFSFYFVKYLLNKTKNSHLCLFPFFPEMFCKDKAFISNYQKIIELF